MNERNQYLTELPPELEDAQKAFVREAVSSKAPGLDAFGHMSDEWVAARVRMLMRSDPWHEPICSAGRDRIIRLALKVEHLQKELHDAQLCRVSDVARDRLPPTPAPQTSNLRSRAYYLGLAETVRRVANEQKLYRETTIKELREAGDALIRLANATPDETPAPHLITQAQSQDYINHAVGKQQAKYRDLFSEFERVNAEAKKYREALDRICENGRNPVAEAALNCGCCRNLDCTQCGGTKTCERHSAVKTSPEPKS